MELAGACYSPLGAWPAIFIRLESLLERGRGLLVTHTGQCWIRPRFCGGFIDADQRLGDHAGRAGMNFAS